MAYLGGLASLAVAGKAGINASYLFAGKVDGTWVEFDTVSKVNATFATSANATDGTEYDLVWTDTIEYENTSASNQSLTECVVVTTQDPAAEISALNADQTATSIQNSMIYPINTVVGSPQTIVPDQIIRFTNIRLIIQTA